MVESWNDVVLISLIFGFSIAYFLWATGYILKTVFDEVNSKKFKKDFIAAVIHSKPTWEEIQEIIKLCKINRARAYEIIQIVMRDILIGKEIELEKHQELIKSYIEQHNDEVPFEGIPSEIRIHLERIKEKYMADPVYLESLTVQIQELVSVNDREKKKQKYISIASLFIGLVGALATIYSMYS